MERHSRQRASMLTRTSRRSTSPALTIVATSEAARPIRGETDEHLADRFARHHDTGSRLCHDRDWDVRELERVSTGAGAYADTARRWLANAGGRGVAGGSID